MKYTINKPSGFKIQWIKFDETGSAGYFTLPLPKAYSNMDFLAVRQLNRNSQAGDTWAASTYAENIDTQHVRIYKDNASTGKGGIVTFGL